MLGIFEIFIFLCVFGYLLNKARAKEMVDVLQTYMQDAISLVRLHRPETSNHDDNRGATDYGTRLRANEKQRQRNQYKEQEKDALDRSLFHVKESKSPTLQLPSKPLNGLACQFCAPMNSENQIDPNLAQEDVINILNVGTYNQSSTEKSSSLLKLVGFWFPFLAHCIRLPGHLYPQVAPAVLKDDGLNSAIATAVEKSMEELQMNNIDQEHENDDNDEQYENILHEHKTRAKTLLTDMRSKISDILLRIASLVMFKLLPMFMSGVVVHPAHIEMLKKVAKSNPNVPLIFLPLHRSHLDYILVTFILYNNQIRAPIVAAGDNLSIPFFGALLRGLGAFYIKRKIDPVAGKKDIVYRAVLHTYMQHALRAQHNVEFFIEGGRTRTGKPCMPKSGVLSVIIDALNADTIKDALLVPVSINYERLCDGNFAYEQMGEKKKPENFTRAVASIWKTLNSNHGQMRIDFNEPFSLRELVNVFEKSTDPHDSSPKRMSNNTQTKRLKQQPSTSSLYGTDVVNEEHRALVDSIARHVVYDCASATACMTTNAVAFLLLTRFRDGDTIDVLADALDDLRRTLHGVRAINFTGDSRDIIEYAANLFGPTLVACESRDGTKFIKPVKSVRSIIELSYYSNSLAAHFALDAVVICSLLKMAPKSEIESNSNSGFSINRSDLIQSCKQYCDILRYEFLFNKPCQKLDNLLENSIDRLKDQYLLSIPSEMNNTDKIKARQLCAELNDDSDDSLSGEFDNITIALPPEGTGKRAVLKAMLEPYSCTYMTVIRSLNILLKDGLLESEFVRFCIQEITKQVENGHCKYEESISTDTIRNCMKMLEKSGYIEITNGNGTRAVALQKNYDSIKDVRNITQRIESIVTALD